MAFGKNLKESREKQGCSQTELANRLNVTQATVAIWENGNALPRANKLPDIARELKCSVNDLFED